jgi:hypothetical protein
MNAGTSIALPAETHLSRRTQLCNLPDCDITLGSLILSAPEAGYFVDLVLLYVIILKYLGKFQISLQISLEICPTSAILD